MLNNFPKPAVCEFSAPMIPIVKGFIVCIDLLINFETKGRGAAKANEDTAVQLPNLCIKDRLDSMAIGLQFHFPTLLVGAIP